jgi:hypothetical protein
MVFFSCGEVTIENNKKCLLERCDKPGSGWKSRNGLIVWDQYGKKGTGMCSRDHLIEWMY